MIRYLVVMLGAALGGLARYVAGVAVAERYAGRFPMGTFLINVTGSFCIGIAMTLLTERFAVNPNWRLFVVVGILGGYTTFSSFEWEALFAARNGAPWMGLLYVLSSVVAGYLAVWLGLILARR